MVYLQVNMMQSTGGLVAQLGGQNDGVPLDTQQTRLTSKASQLGESHLNLE